MEHLTKPLISASYYLAGRQSKNEMKFRQIPYTAWERPQRAKERHKRKALLRVQDAFGFLRHLGAYYGKKSTHVSAYLRVKLHALAVTVDKLEFSFQL